MNALQPLVVATLVAWAAWHVWGALAPWHRRRRRAALARLLDGRLPGWLVARVRPPAIATDAGCGCSSGCGGPARSQPD